MPWAMTWEDGGGFGHPFFFTALEGVAVPATCRRVRNIFQRGTIFARMVTPSGWSLPLAVAPRQRWSLRPTDAAATLIIYTIVKTPGFGAEPQGRWLI